MQHDVKFGLLVLGHLTSAVAAIKTPGTSIFFLNLLIFFADSKKGRENTYNHQIS